MEEILNYLEDLENKGVRLNEEEGKLKYNAPKGVVTKEDLGFLKANKEKVIEVLRSKQTPVTLEINQEKWYEPFPLTSIQEAYLLGRSKNYNLGGVSCHIYLEVAYDNLDDEKVEDVWNQLVSRHGMLRTIFNQKGYQKELKEVHRFKILKANDSKTRDEMRQNLSNKSYEVNQWPLFDIGISHTDEGHILHYSTEFLIVDWTSIWRLLGEFEAIYFRNQRLPELTLHFRDYVLGEKQFRVGRKYENDKEYWMQKIPMLPEAPKMPRKANNQVKDSFKRMQLEISPSKWQQLKDKCKAAGVTPTSLILTIYAKVLARFSEEANFCINMIMLNRLPLHEEVNQIVGDFTSNTLIPIDLKVGSILKEEIGEINRTLFEALDHGMYSGVEILRELSRQKGKEAAFMPVVFTSAIGSSNQNNEIIGRIRNTGISQTPQVFIDCQVMDGAFGLRINWDIREGVFLDGYAEDMFEVFKNCIFKVAKEECNWNESYEIKLPKWQQEERKIANNTNSHKVNETLHGAVLKQARKTPEDIAVIDKAYEFTYSELIARSMKVAKVLKNLGCKAGENVGIIMPKSAYQVVAALGILIAGGVYVPIDDGIATVRNEKILERAKINIVLVCNETNYNVVGREVVVVDEIKDETDSMELIEEGMSISQDPELPAYIIHTSGSTGEPKGVVISHKAALNTIEDINRRFNVGTGDCTFGLSQLNFDLSVYDIFGLLSIGGRVVYPDKEKYADASYWVQLIKEYNVSVWNSVPSLMVMLQEYLETKKEEKLEQIKVVLLSGDWIPLHLPEKLKTSLPNAQVVSLGGATEAGIWSIYHKYQGLEADWVSIPYGKPLANQQFYVLNNQFEECPIGLKGELYIAGDGLALEYYNDEIRTKERFFVVPSLGKRVYRTGDMGRYMKGGEIEFLGREDKQVKILGFRIELGEIEAALKQYEDVENAVVITKNFRNSTKIMAAVWSQRGVINEDEIKEFIKEKLPSYMMPYHVFTLQEVPLTANGKVDRKAIEKCIDKCIENIFVEQETVEEVVKDTYTQEIEKVVCNVLGIESIGIKDDFYVVGADSLMMNRIAANLTEVYGEKYDFEEILIQVLNYSNVEAVSKFIKEKLA
ncbi:non-ribosomal peptide synthetase [Cellulosilyticum ruminicola]|uniref:non-ribosomal peptide synthetase n=1 Tax=Cellulosilyticum ruminicola TaxID=425254 RepID=UPI0006D00FB6|nr:non-ribosomal peptide synthetase [Cellulosilyticum ruminicola]